MRKNQLIIIVFFLLGKALFSQHQVIETYNPNDANHKMFVTHSQMFTEQWDTLPQQKFWQKIMSLSPDSCIINCSSNREILCFASLADWKRMNESEKMCFKDSLKALHCIEDSLKIFVTSGKKDFYDFNAVMPSISRGVEVFMEQGVDPWFAQAILLIESPGKMQYSSAGAYGPFQLMKSVAKKYGLRVDKKIDERRDFDKSAVASARLIGLSCIPEARRILINNNIAFSETDLWFKLFVLHIYHAGAGNVNALITHMGAKEGGKNLITSMWQTEYKGFKNVSQNYSQLALASQFILDDLIRQKCTYIYSCDATSPCASTK